MRRPRRLRVALSGLARPLEFVDCPELAHGFAAILRGWDVHAVPLEGGPEPLASFRLRGGVYEWTSGPPSPEWARKPPATMFEAICDLHYELIDWFLEENPSHMCLHCAAVQFGSGLVVFPSPRRAGKSTLVLQLAAAGGCRVFGDDVLPVEPGTGHGMALGILPRVRLPLPGTIREETGTFLESRKGPGDRHYQYVGLAESELAPFGAVSPVRGLVLLDRRGSGPAEMTPVSEGEMLKLIIRRNFADEVPAPDLFDRLAALTAAAGRWRLRYADGRQASAALAEAFGKTDG